MFRHPLVLQMMGVEMAYWLTLLSLKISPSLLLLMPGVQFPVPELFETPSANAIRWIG
jgi:hypothetical protein